MTPVDMTSACSGFRTASLGGPGRHLPRIGVALVARAGVGHARVDRHDSDRITWRPLAVDFHRGRAHQVFGVHARRHGRPIGDNKRQIELRIAAFHTGVNAGSSVT